uniref:Uncharacterized protein n=1 Tax=Sphenodon punctatus TaxID=8508 RepID=A0A8D0LD74_SPHPU
MAVEVRGIPPDVEEELLVLYFENRRRSGGGPVQECKHRGSWAVVTFENPEDATRVLAQPSHALQDAQLVVSLAAPRDYGKVVLRGLSPQISPTLLELYVERMLSCEGQAYTVHRSPAGDQALVQLPEPLSHTEFLALERCVQGRPLEGAPLAVDWVQQTDSVLVQSRGAGLSQDLLELYFESRRSGGGSVRGVRLLPAGGAAAVVSFHDWAVVARVLQKPHCLQENSLEVSPHYDFLEPAAAAAAASPSRVPVPDAEVQRLLESSPALQELGAAFPEFSLQLDEAGVLISGGDAAQAQQVQEHVQRALQDVTKEDLPLPAWPPGFLQRQDVREQLVGLLARQGLAACYVPAATMDGVTVWALTPAAARAASSLLASALCPISLPVEERHLDALVSPRWAQLQAGLRCCCVRIADSGEQLQGLTLRGLEQENTERLAAFLQDGPDESLLPMEPGTLRYLQLYYQELLASLAEVTVMPLEGTDVTGLRLSGVASACRAAAEFLQSLLGTVSSQPVTLQLPGVARFLLDERGEAIVREQESRFRCIIVLDRVRWSPPDTQHELERSQEPLALSCRRDSLPGSKPLDGASSPWSAANMEEIKDLLAALEPSASLGGSGTAASSPRSPSPEDLYTAEEVGPGTEQKGSADGKEEPVAAGTPDLAKPSSEEEAQLLLAIQQSMERAWQEEEELRRATELSLRCYQQEQAPVPADANLQATLDISLADALQSADSARLTVFAAFEQDVSALPRQLEAALQARLQEERLESEVLRVLPALCHEYLTYLQRKHAVHISLDGSVATIHGFADYTVGAARDLALLLTRLAQAEVAAGSTGGARWVRWEPLGDSNTTPYSSQASALLEQAWQRGHKRLDILFDGRPFTIDFERMEEYDLGSTRDLPISRTEPLPERQPTPPGRPQHRSLRRKRGCGTERPLPG